MEMYDETLHFEKLYRIAQLLIGIQSENYDKPVQTNVEVLHSCVQSKKTPVGGCHNGLFGVLRCVCTVVVKWWSKNVK